MFYSWFFRAFAPIFHFKLCNFVGGVAKLFFSPERKAPYRYATDIMHIKDGGSTLALDLQLAILAVSPLIKFEFGPGLGLNLWPVYNTTLARRTKIPF